MEKEDASSCHPPRVERHYDAVAAVRELADILSSQTKAAWAIGQDPSVISHWKSGRRIMSCAMAGSIKDKVAAVKKEIEAGTWEEEGISRMHVSFSGRTRSELQAKIRAWLTKEEESIYNDESGRDKEDRVFSSTNGIQHQDDNGRDRSGGGGQ